MIRKNNGKYIASIADANVHNKKGCRRELFCYLFLREVPKRGGKKNTAATIVVCGKYINYPKGWESGMTLIRLQIGRKNAI